MVRSEDATAFRCSLKHFLLKKRRISREGLTVKFIVAMNERSPS